ncbi:MAG TPA: LacI family DNA-binding transcriptional regulator [Acidobacteriaceae bacterium]|nr:LacI family DNA-binding transcriptional regulator [Acidobacteriaceae bacterium]
MNRKVPNGEQRVTLGTLAEHLSLSKTTVSVVISGSPAAKSIPPETRARILQAARELHYRPHYLARSLRRNRTMSVGVMVPELGEGYFTLVMNGIEQHLLTQHYFYFTASHYWKPDLLEKYPRMLLDRSVEGLLLVNTPLPEDVDVPIVSVSGHKAAKNVTNVVLDHERAAVLALSHLRDLRHRRIAFMRGQAFTADTDERWQSIARTAREMGLAIDPAICMKLEANTWSPQLGYEPVTELLRHRRDFTAIFCFNDTSAFGAMRALRDVGLRVPEDVSVIGFDDVVGAQFTTPSLTTVRQPLFEMGRTAAEILLRRITHPSARCPAQVVMQPELMVRESTAQARAVARIA